jgi:hypothetical protein
VRPRAYAAMLAACMLAIFNQTNEVIAAIYLAAALIILGSAKDPT